MKKILIVTLAAMLALSCLAFSACSGETVDPGQTPGGSQAENNAATPDNMINCYIAFSGTSYTATDSSAPSTKTSASPLIVTLPLPLIALLTALTVSLQLLIERSFLQPMPLL